MQGIRFELERLGNTHEEIFLQALKLSQTDSSTQPPAVRSQLVLGQGVHSVKGYFGGQPRMLIVDTGSADTAFPCAGCGDRCGHFHQNPPYQSQRQTRNVTCDENDHRGFTGCKFCGDNDVCYFSEDYVEGSGWKAIKVQDKMHFESRPELAANIVFGCIYEENGAFQTQTADGIMGMSQDPDAIFIQFYDDGITEMRGFSQCISKNGGSMVIGGIDNSLNAPNKNMVFTPIRSTGYTYWTVYLSTVEVGGLVLDVDASVYNQNRGCVFDSGTTFVYMPMAVKSEFQSKWSFAMAKDPKNSHYVEGKEYALDLETLDSLPEVCFTFENEAKMCIPASQYMVHDFGNVYTSTIFFQDFAHATIIGASMLANYNILYDMDNTRIGFVQANCDLHSQSTSFDSTTSLKLVTNIQGYTFQHAFSIYNYPITIGFVLGVCMLLIIKKIIVLTKPASVNVENAELKDELIHHKSMESECQYQKV